MKRLSSSNKVHNCSRFVLEVYSPLLYDVYQNMGYLDKYCIPEEKSAGYYLVDEK